MKVIQVTPAQSCCYIWDACDAIPFLIKSPLGNQAKSALNRQIEKHAIGIKRALLFTLLRSSQLSKPFASH